MAFDLDLDRERLADATHVLHGPRGGGAARSEVLYAAYVAVILAGLYGFPVLRALVVAADPQATAAALRSPWAVVVCVVGVGALAAVTREAGRVRGPIVAPVPWVDLVVASSIDRWVTLRAWFGYSLFAALFAGGLGGIVAGAALAGAGAAPWWVVPITVVTGVLIGLIAGTTWLLGQTRGASTVDSLPLPADLSDAPPWAREVRRLGLTDLRTQASRSTRIVGGVHAGDLRAVRLEAARPVSRGRGLRLRHRGPIGTLIGRDSLGLRRSPGSTLVGILVSVTAGVALGGALASAAIPPLVGFVAGLVSYLGFSALAEGVRLEADTIGTPALFGVTTVRAAAAHLVVPGLLHVVATLAGGVGAAVVVDASAGEVVPWLIMTTLYLCGTTLLAAFRGRPPVSAFNPAPTPATVAIWYAAPAVLSTLLIGGTVWGAVRWPTSGLVVIISWVAAANVVYSGLKRVQTESLAHRDV